MSKYFIGLDYYLFSKSANSLKAKIANKMFEIIFSPILIKQLNFRNGKYYKTIEMQTNKRIRHAAS